MSCTCFYHAPEVHGPGGCALAGCACKWDGKDEQPLIHDSITKRLALDDIWIAWLKAPEMRLGQLIANALNLGTSADSAKLYHASDEALVTAIRQFAKTGVRPPR